MNAAISLTPLHRRVLVNLPGSSHHFPAIPCWKLAEAIGVHAVQVRPALEELVSHGLVAKHGPFRSESYSRTAKGDDLVRELGEREANRRRA